MHRFSRLRASSGWRTPTCRRGIFGPGSSPRLKRNWSRCCEVQVVVLAGFMRVLKEQMLAAFPRRIVNIHPSLLPKFAGLEAWKQALAANEKWTGVTVHYVDEKIDHGDVIAERKVPVMSDDTAESLHARIQKVEHVLYPEALEQVLAQLRAA